MRFYLYSLIAAIALGLMPLFKKLAIVAGTDTVIVAQASSGVAALVALGLLGRAPAYRLQALFARANLPHLVLIGTLGSGIVVLLNIEAMQVTSATNRSLFQAMYPAATVFFAWRMLGERLRPVQYRLIALMIAGLFLMNSTAAGLQLNRGFWLLLLTLPIIGFCDAHAKRHLARIPAPLMAMGRILFGLALLTAALPWAGPGGWDGLRHSGHWILLGGLCNAVGLFAFYRALDLRPAGLAAALVSFAPVVTAVGEWLGLGTSLSWHQVLGLLLVLAGAAWLALRS